MSTLIANSVESMGQVEGMGLHPVAADELDLIEGGKLRLGPNFGRNLAKVAGAALVVGGIITANPVAVAGGIGLVAAA